MYLNLELTKKQQKFIEKHKIVISDGYIGMIRAYREDKAIWQTPAWNPVYSAVNQSYAELTPAVLEKRLKPQLHKWLNEIMSLNKSELNNVFSRNINLFDKIEV